MAQMSEENYNDTDIAIVGMAARLPRARTIEEYWRNLREGIESVRTYTDEELLAEGELPENLRKPNYIRSGTPLEDVEMFDAEFFGFSPKEAAIMDPQHRHFIEVAWEALENAGHPPEKFEGSIGVFGGVGMNAYFVFNLLTNRELVDSVGLFLLRHTSNDKDFLTTRVSYLLNLTGPAINVQTACSTSLVAAHLACQSLLAGECDLALAGGVTIEVPHRRGYLYHEGEVLSPTGHCHAFDHRSQGTVFGSGAGVVALRRLKDALEDGDHIHAIIKGSAINNDGSSKVGYLAPSVDGQAAAMVEAYAVAGIGADTLDYVECHGTGTYMGDPIEVSALTEAFRRSTKKRQFCRIGSVKTNIGHLDTAAGVASLIKATLALRHREIPPTLNFEKPNPNIDFETSPFIVNDRLTEWPRREHPRRAAVNSLGVGGTNAHLVLEEAPELPPTQASKRPYQLLALSARNKRSLDEATRRLAEHLRQRPEQELADVAFTLLEGRRAFDQRRVLAVADREEAIRLLSEVDPKRVFSHSVAGTKPSVVFMFPGGGSQYPAMGRDLYASEPVFKAEVDRGLRLAKEKYGIELAPFFFPEGEGREATAKAFEDVKIQLPAIFIIEHALAKLWMSWGIQPAAMVGHSLGENAAACVAGVLSYEDALGLVVLRGRLVDRVSRGTMLSVELSEAELTPLLGDKLDLGIVNTPGLCVASGTVEDVAELEAELVARGLEPKRLRIVAAGHSRMLDPILREFGDYLRSIRLSAPKIPFVSNVTGTWITDAEAKDPEYFVRHLRRTVRFADCVKTLLETEGRVFLEVGPGRILASLVRQHPDTKPGTSIISSLRHPDEKLADDAYFLTVFGRLWASGVVVDAGRLFEGEARRRVELPTYAWSHSPYWIKPGKVASHGEDLEHLERRENLDDWFYRPAWRPRSVDLGSPPNGGYTWLVFADDGGLSSRVLERLSARGETVVVVRPGDAYLKRSDTEYVLSPEHGREGYDALIRDLVASGKTPNRVVHLWMLTADESFRPGSSFFHRNQERGFYSLLFLAQALGEENVPRPLHLTTFANGVLRVKDEAVAYPEKATLLGPAKVIPRELSGVTSVVVDMVLPKLDGNRLGELLLHPRELLGRMKSGSARPELDLLADQVVEEALGSGQSGVAAWRGQHRYQLDYERRSVRAPEKAQPRLRERGVYLITGGLGGLGLVVAEHLARAAKARLVLLGRSGLPDRDQWEELLAKQGSSHPLSKKILQVQALEAAGAEVMVVAADVTDLEGMRRAIAEAEARFGRLHGVVHTAGVVKDNLIALKQLSEVEEVFAPKVHGTMVLDTLLGDRELDFVVLFSSTSTVIAPPGQVDYVAANAFLNAYAESRAGRPTYTVALNWGLWNEVGLAAESLVGKHQGPKPLANRATRHPMFDLWLQDEGGDLLLEGTLGAKRHWVLDEHRTKAGEAIIPGTGYLELARAALREHGEAGPFELEDLFFFRPLHVEDDTPKPMRVRLRRNQRGYTFEVRSRRVVDGRTGWQLHAQANVRLGRVAPAKALPLADIEARCTRDRRGDPAGLRTDQEAHVRFGPRWRVLRQASLGAGEGLATLELDPRFAADLEDYELHPGLLDIGTGWAMRLIEGYRPETLWVPVSYERVRFFGPLPRRMKSWVKVRNGGKPEGDFVRFDVVLATEAGEVRVAIEGFAIRHVGAAMNVQEASRPSPGEIELEQKGGDGERQLSPQELRLARNLERGIRPAEGTEALARILAGGTAPEILVTSMDLDALIRQADASVAEPRDSDTKFERPELDSEYIGPRDEVERTLVSFWEELLGVKQVGVKDSFFDLGGHSLIAVRLFAQIKRSFKVDYPISVLFEAPTIERCASMIKDAIGHVEGAVEAPKDAAAVQPKAPPRPRFTYLVPMHHGEGNGQRPFFLVAGMFGNVLNLRHLAHLIATERPFYGLQARGLFGDDEPHETFEEAARDYIAEMRVVQPHGPYLLGGFSGGGITALEIAKQLRAAGEETALLVMLDTRPPRDPQPTRKERVMMHMQRLQRDGGKYLTEWGQNRLDWEVKKLKKRLNGSPAVEETPATFHNQAIEAAFRAALERYQVSYHPGKMVLFRPKLEQTYVFGPNRVMNSQRVFVYHDNDWGQFFDEVEVHEVPGNHDSMVLEPTVRVLASHLRGCIERAEAEWEEQHRPRENLERIAIPKNGKAARELNGHAGPAGPAGGPHSVVGAP